MNYESYIEEAMEIVSAWEVAPEDFAQAVNDQAKLMAWSDLQPLMDYPTATPDLDLYR